MTDPAALRTTFLDAMSRVAASVTLVTTDGPAGRHGTTVSAMTSVSADGPLPTLLVCLNRTGETAPAVLANGIFAVNLLDAGHARIADVFARRRPAPGGDKFAAAAFDPLPSGAPCLRDALAAFDCRLVDSLDVGSHHVCIGAVTDIRLRSGEDPLLWLARGYARASSG